MRKKKLAMVDLDGTLIDTLEANYRAYKEALQEVGCALTRDYYAEHCDGRSYKDFLPELLGSGSDDIERVHEKKIALYPACLVYAKVNEPLLDILKGLKDEYYLALVTTASKVNAEKILRHFSLTELFDRVVTQEDMVRPKPAPDCYIKTREDLGIEAGAAIIFEDSPTGAASALASGSQVFRLSRPQEPSC